MAWRGLGVADTLKLAKAIARASGLGRHHHPVIFAHWKQLTVRRGVRYAAYIHQTPNNSPENCVFYCRLGKKWCPDNPRAKYRSCESVRRKKLPYRYHNFAKTHGALPDDGENAVCSVTHISRRHRPIVIAGRGNPALKHHCETTACVRSRRPVGCREIAQTTPARAASLDRRLPPSADSWRLGQAVRAGYCSPRPARDDAFRSPKG